MTVFALGGFTCVVSILRLQSLYVISKATDVSWNNPLAAIWSSVEINTGILCSCLPTLKACVSRYFPRIFNTKISRSTTRQNGQRSNHYTNDSRHKIAFEDLGRGLSDRDGVVQKSVIQSRVGGSDEYDMPYMGSLPKGHELDDGQMFLSKRCSEGSLGPRRRARRGWCTILSTTAGILSMFSLDHGLK